ncbi:DUF4160 domain-containing protein [Paraburkholderia caribensis]|uniref:DUF4160 domain-containing protein n=1 Tax=Paraburkholderia caribensis TaxID=75105 RepID=UPI000D152D5C|nr:DUF4160 domain-containing protein [Paraburkholderia caribensis]
MPTVIRFEGLRVAIYTNDHPPPHVHVLGPNREAIFELNCPNGPVSLRESYNFTGRELQGVADLLNGNIPDLCKKWGDIHGNH